MNPLWRIELLGGLCAKRLDGETTLDQCRSHQAGALLAFLAYFPRPHERETLIELLWPAENPELSRNRLRVVLARLRSLLEPPEVEANSILVANRQTIFLHCTSDVAEFEATLEAASQISGVEQIAALTKVVESYRGALLPGFYENWIVSEAQRLEERYFVALRHLVAQLEKIGDLERAIHFARRGASFNALREDVTRDLMRLYAAQGLPALALKQFHELECALQRQSKTAPSFQSCELRRQIEGEKISLPPAPKVALPKKSLPEKPPEPLAIAEKSPLPTQWTRFFGRRTELDALRNLWADPKVRLVTLTGPGGTGKTRLALETARLWREVWQSEITLYFVPLADISQASDVPLAIAERIGDGSLWPTTGPNSALERLLPALCRVASPVLVLDNLEHLLPDGVGWIQALLQRAPNLRILATSRHPLEIAGETVLPVPLLPVPPPETPAEELLEWDSIQLFTDRARLVRPRFQISKHNSVAVARLCQRLEGWPLALEFCAARADQLAPWQMLQKLENRLDFLAASPDFEKPERHSTLRAALEWSAELLWPDLRRFFAGLGVFRGGTTEAATFVTGQTHAAHFLHQLSAASLLHLDENGRFTLLETVREFATEQLSADELGPLRQRHATYFWEVIEATMPDLQSPESARRLNQLNRLKIEHENFRAALEWSLEGDPVLALRLVEATSKFWAELFGEAHNLAERALEKAANLAPKPLVSTVLTIAANGAARRGDYRQQYELSRQRLELARELDDELQLGWAWFHVGFAAWEIGEHQNGEAAYEEAVRIFRAIASQGKNLSNEQNVAWTLNRLGVCATERRDWETAERIHLEASEIFARVGDRDGQAGEFAQLGDLARQRGDWETAQRYFGQTAAIERELSDTRGHPWRQLQRGRLAWAQNQMTQARDFFGRALAGFDETHDFTGVLLSLLALACLEARDEPTRAATLLTFEMAQRETRGLALPLDWWKPRELAVKAVRAALDEDEFQAAIARAEKWELEQAVRLARES